jgi:hypothetical protein
LVKNFTENQSVTKPYKKYLLFSLAVPPFYYYLRRPKNSHELLASSCWRRIPRDGVGSYFSKTAFSNG